MEQKNINIKKRKTCEREDCNIFPCFNFEGELQALYCKEHSKPEMIDIKSKRCQETGCKTTPTFNFEGEIQALYCKEHSKSGMLDIKHKKCQETECKTRAWYGFPGIQHSCCAKHKQVGMIPHPKKTCEIKDCGFIATFGIHSVPQRCDYHKQPTDKDLILKRCFTCQEPSITDEDQMCDLCTTRKGRIYLRRQRQVKAIFDQSNLPKYNFYDKIIFDTTQCGKERPDFVWDCGTHLVILEVDEYQHQSRPCECEQTRMVNITQGYHTPCIWIRFNPDEYKGQKESIREIHRFERLIKTIQESLTMIPKNNQETLRVCHLFFDGFNLNQSNEYISIPCL